MADSPNILKYFYEEPAILEPVTPDSDPDARRRTDRVDLPDNVSVPLDDLLDTRDAHRGYLAGTNRADGAVGLTTLRCPDAFRTPLIEALGGRWWGQYPRPDSGEKLSRSKVREVLGNPTDTSVLVTSDRAVDLERLAAVAGRERRRVLASLRSLLRDVHVVFFPEPAHDGYDWSFFSARPMRSRLEAAFRSSDPETVRRFIVPYQQARSESKFYFEQWQLTESSLPDYVEEV